MTHNNPAANVAVGRIGGAVVFSLPALLIIVVIERPEILGMDMLYQLMSAIGH